MFNWLNEATKAVGDWTNDAGDWMATNVASFSERIPEDVIGAALSAAIGGGAGAAAYGTIGGIGVVFGGIGVGITLPGFVVIGAGVGLAAYGVYRLGEEGGGLGDDPQPQQTPPQGPRPMYPRGAVEIS